MAAQGSEVSGGHAAEGEGPRSQGGDPDRADTLDGLLRAVTAVRSKPIDELDDRQVTDELRVVEQACRQLSARQARLAAARSSRAARRARDAARTAGRAEDAAAGQATRQVRRELADDLGWSPSQAKQAVDLGRRLDPAEAAGRAFDAGQLSPRHAAVLADTLRWISGAERRDEAENELLPLAATQDAVTFGRTCRRLLGEMDPAGAEQAADRRRGRRTGSVAQTEDGMTAVSGKLSGVDGELFTTAFHAFRRPDATDERRSPEQAGADALVAMARAALDAGTARASRRVRPHVTVTIDWQTVLGERGVPDGAWTGPLPVTEVRRLLADCGVARLLTDPDGAPFEAGEAVRNVPVGLYRALEARDGGCIADGCDMPARYCQVMHLEVPYRLGGRLTLDTAGLGCPHHHDALDRRGWKITWIGGRPVLHHPDRPPDASPGGPRADRVAAGPGPATLAEPEGRDRSADRRGSAPDVSDGDDRGGSLPPPGGTDPPNPGTPPATPLRLLDDDP